FFNRYVGLTGDIGGYYRSVNVGPPGFNYQDPVSQYTFLFGPTLRLQPRHRGPFLFTHALFGADVRRTHPRHSHPRIRTLLGPWPWAVASTRVSRSLSVCDLVLTGYARTTTAKDATSFV